MRLATGADNGGFKQMAEVVSPVASPIDPEKRREELAFLEGHDADIPTDDQTPGASIPKAPANGVEVNGLERLNVPGPTGDQQYTQDLGESRSAENESPERGSNKTLGENNEKIHEANDTVWDSQGSENHSGKAHDLEIGHKSSSTSHTETEMHVAEPQDPNIVWWDGPNDPENPITWSEPLKIGNVAVISMITLITQVALIYLLRQIADYFEQASSILNVRSGRATSDGRVQIDEYSTRILRRLSLHPWLRIRPLFGRPIVRAVRSSPNLPRLQCRLRCLDYCLRCQQQPEHAHRLPVPGRSLWVRTPDVRRWIHSRYDHPGKARWYDGHMGYGSSSGTRGRSRGRWLLIASKRMAMGVLVDYHSGEFEAALLEYRC